MQHDVPTWLGGSGVARGGLAELILEAFTGRHFNVPSDLTREQPRRGTELTFSEVSYEAKSFKPSPYYGYRIAYFPSSRSWLGLSLEFLHLKAFADNGRVYRARLMAHARNRHYPSQRAPRNASKRALLLTETATGVKLSMDDGSSLEAGNAFEFFTE